MAEVFSLRENAVVAEAPDTGLATPGKRPRDEVPEGPAEQDVRRRKPGGRPKSPKKLRPPVHAAFKAQGSPTAEGWGYIKGFVEGHRGAHFTSRDLAVMFNTPQTSILRHLGMELGEATLSEQACYVPGPEADAARRDAVDWIIAQNKMASLATVKATLKEQGVEVSRSTVWNDCIALGLQAKARPITPWDGGDHAVWVKDRPTTHRYVDIFVAPTYGEMHQAERRVHWVLTCREMRPKGQKNTRNPKKKRLLIES